MYVECIELPSIFSGTPNARSKLKILEFQIEIMGDVSSFSIFAEVDLIIFLQGAHAGLIRYLLVLFNFVYS